MGLGTYFRNIKDAALTIGDGMAVTFSHLVRKPFTIQYPDRLPDGVRVQDNNYYGVDASAGGLDLSVSRAIRFT